MNGSPTDVELEAVKNALLAQDADGTRIGRVLRNTIDQLYDGQRTGRYRWDQLFKTEKTHCGTLVEINLQREFLFSDGIKLDYKIAGVEVDCKYSQDLNGWMIPPEAHGHICLLLTASDTTEPRWSLGVLRVQSDLLNLGSNRDKKATLNAAGRAAIIWLFKSCVLPANVLLQLDADSVENMMKLRSGQQRINQLFRIAAGKIVGRAVVATAAQQDDYMKRVRANGGARTTLKREGLIILGQYESHRSIARLLEIPVPNHGETISIRIAPAERYGAGVAKIGSRYWKVATDKDPVVMAPELPKI